MPKLAAQVLPLLLAVLIVSAGCSNILGDGALEYSASDVSIDEDTVAAAGYTSSVDRTQEVNRTVDVQEESRQLTVQSHVVAYEKNYGEERTGTVVVISTPKAEKFGQALNPLGHLDKTTLISRALSRAQLTEEIEVENVTERGTTDMQTLGDQTEVTTYDATMSRAGTTVDVTVQVTRLEHGEDFLIVVGMYPTSVDEGLDDFERMLGGLEHETDE